MAASTFAQRIARACELSEAVPAQGEGRQSVIAAHLGVSQEAVRKWFHGLSRPQHDKLKKLADFLGVEESWLAVGSEPELDRDERKTFARNIDGSVLLVRGLLTLAGASCAEPGPRDPRRSYVDLYVIQQGRQVALHVSSAHEAAPDKFLVAVPKEFEDVQCVAVIRKGKGAFDYINLPSDLIRESKTRKGGDFAVEMVRSNGRYTTGQATWPKITSFEDFK